MHMLPLWVIVHVRGEIHVDFNPIFCHKEALRTNRKTIKHHILVHLKSTGAG